MLHVGQDSHLINHRSAPGNVLSLAEFVVASKAFVRRQAPILLFFPILSVTIALLYLATATPKFTAEAVLLVEPKRSDGSTQSGDVASAAQIMDSQVEILKSEKIALSIIHTLELTKDPEFGGPSGGLVGTVLGLISWIGAPEPDTQFSLTRRALERFYRRLTVKRVALTYTIAIQFESSSPDRAAQVANAVARAYTADQMEANYEAAHAATEWLQGRVDVLHTKALDAQKRLTDYKATHPLTNQAPSELRELETSAQVYRQLYDTFLQRYLESAEQQSFPVSQGRLMTVASPPLRTSSPKTFLVLAVSTAGGIIVGIGVAFLRDVSDLTFRTRDKVLAELHTACIGIIPAGIPDSSGNDPPSVRPNPVRARSRTIVWADRLTRNIADSPRSPFSESFRSVKLAVDIMNRGGKRIQVIGVTSALPNEGKSTVAASLAQIMAQGGGRAILLDCDLRNPSLSSALAPDARLGLLDVTSGEAKLDDATWIDPATSLHFLPATNSSRLANTCEVLASADMAGLFNTLREAYEYLVVDLSPIAPFADVRAAAHLMDSFILVIEWGRTNIDVVKSSLDVAGDVYGSLVGVILNKANVKALKRYGDAFAAQGSRRNAPVMVAAPKPLHVIVATPCGECGPGGIDRLADAITSGLALRKDLNVQITRLRTRGSGSLLFCPFVLSWGLARLCAASWLGRASVVHINVASKGSVYRKALVAAVARLLGVPYVVHLHSGAFDEFWQSAGPRLDALIARLLRNSAAIVVLGRYWSELINSRLPGIESKVVILPNATASVATPPEKAKNGRVRISFFGKLGEMKGTPQLVEALASLRDRADWTATLAGHGDVTGTRERLRHLQMEDRVSVPGWLGPAATADLLRQTDILVQPSFVDNLPMSILEAFARGIPVVATPVGVVPDVVVQNVNGLLVPAGDVRALADALARLIDDPALRQRLGTSAQRDHAARYEINGYLSRLAEIWRKAA